MRDLVEPAILVVKNMGKFLMSNTIYSKSYVYEGTEVRKTGRVATKERTRTSRSGVAAIDSLVEIEPVDPDMSWKKWVNEIHLYTVSGDKNA